jgi:hypothetical protein
MEQAPWKSRLEWAIPGVITGNIIADQGIAFRERVRSEAKKGRYDIISRG